MEFPETVDKKNVRHKVTKYGLSSQRGVPAFRAENLLKTNGFVVSNKNMNCLFLNNGNESSKHFIVKSLIFKILRERGRRVGTEIEVENAIVDVLDLDMVICYEVETNLTKKKIQEKLGQIISVKDIFFIDTRQVPDDFYEAEKYLKNQVV